jgi:multiple sugar transport system ATP-binding protein
VIASAGTISAEIGPAPFLRMCALSKRFGSTTALRDVSIDLGANELLVVLGPTGAGKTTLLRTIAGLEHPNSGRVEMASRDVTADAPAARDVALVFQNFSLYPDRTVRQNMEFPLRAPGRNLSREQIRKQVDWAAGLLKIAHLLDRPSTRLSGGEMQRVAIGRAIVRRPRIFLMDEPLTNLDAKLREALRVELVMLRRELMTPMVFVTHDQAEALSMADRIVVLSGGRVLQTGTPQEVYCRPVSPEVARQLGQPAINVLRVRRQNGELLAQNAAIAPALATDAAELLIGVRPEDISTAGGSVEASVKVVEDMGPTFTVLADWLGQEIRLIAAKGNSLRPGDRIFPRINADRIVRWPAPAAQGSASFNAAEVNA